MRPDRYVNGDIERVPKRATFWRFPMPWGQGLEKVSIFNGKGTSVRGSTSFPAFCVKIGWGCDLQVGWGKIKKVTNIVYISHIYPEAPAAPIVTKFVLGADFLDVINCAKFHSNPLRDFDFVGVEFWPFPQERGVAVNTGLELYRRCQRF